MAEEKFEFASPAWRQACRRKLEELFAAQPAVQAFSVCETYTDVPAHVAGGQERFGWHFRVDGNRVDFHECETDDVDFKLVVDYETIVPMARVVYDGNPEAYAEVQGALTRALESGKAVAIGDPGNLQKEMEQLHDYMARLTA